MKLNKKAIIGITLACVLAVAAIFVMAGDREEKQKETVYQNLERFGAVLDKILNYYVDDIDSDKLIKSAINGMLDQLDEHSVYMDSYEYDNLMIDTKGEFGGLGITLGELEGFPTVISTIEDTPAYRVGIQGGDKIVQIEGVSTHNWKSEEAVTKLRGREGTQVAITIAREGLPDSLHYSITREIIRVPSITYSADLDGVGYIRLARFAERTARDLEGVIRDLEKQNVKGLIIDLRSNPGGLLESAREVSELFLDKDKLIVYTESRIPTHNLKYYSRSNKVYDDVPIVVLVNGTSASASEIVAGALQDWDRAVIVGQTSFGKGSVQTVFNIGKDALKLTTAKYFTPSGRCIHKDRPRNEEELISEDLPVPADTATANTGEPHKEYRTAGGRIVYGGGGITPDWQIELPKFTDLQRDLELRSMFFNFAVHYTAHHKVADDFKVTDAVLAEFRSYSGENKYAIKDSLWTPENVDYIQTAIKREVFRKLMQTKGAYLATLPKDEEVNAVLEMFRAAPTLQQMFAYVNEQSKKAVAAERLEHPKNPGAMKKAGARTK
ncbi:MAG: S41 family peptidase [Candidatus Krumholzibacteria bacterium]|nr:S41 family peptidase [Candidatus Krumholzibacteria bacterium]